MKRKMALVTMVCVVIFVLFTLVNMYRGAYLMGRTDTVQSGVHHLANFIEAYRDKYGHYPSSIVEMVTATKSDNQAYLNEILHDQFRSQYNYQPLTNGFVILVETPSSWLIKYDRIEKRYKIGEALK
jgi:hypothetical protein